MRFARVKSHHDARSLRIDRHVAHAFHFQKWLAQLAHAFLTILAFRCDLDGFEDGVIGALRIEGISWVGIVWSRWVHHLFNAARLPAGRLARNRFKHAPYVLSENFLTGRIWMNSIR